MFKQQFDKIVGAYLRNELNPMHSCACFVGNLLNNNNNWNFGGKTAKDCLLKEANNLYTMDEIKELEHEFMYTPEKPGMYWYDMTGKVLDEQGLYEAMERTLLKLKQLHESKGEIIENYTFPKRELQTA